MFIIHPELGWTVPGGNKHYPATPLGYLPESEQLELFEETNNGHHGR